MKTIEKRGADWLKWVGAAGLVLSLVFFAIYITGLVPSGVSPSDSAALWDRPSETYLNDTNLEFTPGWFANITNGYYLSTAALAILATTALPTLIALSLSWFFRRDYLYGGMAITICGVLLVAIIR